MGPPRPRKTAASDSQPVRSASSKRATDGLSRSNTPTKTPFFTSGTTNSDRDAVSHAICPGKACTSGTTADCKVFAAMPHTPLPLDPRLANYIIEGTRDGLVADLDRKRAEGAAPLEI